MTALAILVARLSPAKGPEFVPPHILTASDIPYPVNTATPGIVTVLLNLDATARVENVLVLRDTLPLTSAAQTAVQAWTFPPAIRDGSPVPSTLSVNVVFNPFNPGGAAIEGLAVQLPLPSPASEATPFTPPQISSGSYAVYPVNSMASGTVVLDVTVGKTGGMAKVKVIRDVPSLTPDAIKAVKAWGFSPATFKGQPIAAYLVVAFVFPRPRLRILPDIALRKPSDSGSLALLSHRNSLSPGNPLLTHTAGPPRDPHWLPAARAASRLQSR